MNGLDTDPCLHQLSVLKFIYSVCFVTLYVASCISACFAVKYTGI